MALYVIGDVQGCYDSLRRLLDKVRFDPKGDRLWFTGDLVNRGNDSAGVLRFVASLGDSAISVLGNHDLHLLAVASGAMDCKSGDTFQDVLRAPDREELLCRLARCPLLHRDTESCLVLVHAGILPEWDIEFAAALAREAENLIRGPVANEFYRHMYGNDPNRWSDDLQGWGRARFIVNVFTRIRFCYSDGRVDYTYKGAPGTQPSSLVPWFSAPNRRSGNYHIICGHWSLLGLSQTDHVTMIDTGCCWGGQLTAMKFSNDERRFHSVNCT